MNTPHRGFIVPLLLIIIGVLVLGGGTYMFTQTKPADQPVVATSTAPATNQATPPAQNFAESKKTVPNSQCTDIRNNLSYGSVDATTNGEVSKLQNFLRSKSLFNHEATGYYDNATVLAVKKLQTIFGFDTEFITGNLNEPAPLTRSIIKQVSCGNTSLEEIAKSIKFANKIVNDAIIQSDLAVMQTQAEIYYGMNSTYIGVCSNADIVRAIAGAKTANGGTDPVCNTDGVAYAVSSKLFSDTTRYWCVDSRGSHSTGTVALGTNTVCPLSK